MKGGLNGIELHVYRSYGWTERSRERVLIEDAWREKEAK